MQDPNSVVYERVSLEAAMATNCSYYHGMSVQERFALETPLLVSVLDEMLKNSKVVLDYGIGVGRNSKEILARYPHLEIIGIDNSERMLDHARKHIPKEYFQDKRVKLYPANKINKISDGSIDLVLAVYVLQHISGEFLDNTLNEINRVMSDQSLFYVLNCYRRAVIREERVELYKKLRKAFRFLEHLAEYKQAQRLSIKLDNKTILHDDGINMMDKLSEKFIPGEDIILNSHPHMTLLMKKHFSRSYTKRSTLPPKDL